jgi:nucleoside 2-deoxyribosyltransferase
MKILTYEDSCDKLDKSKPSCFLAGPTIRAHQTHLKSWRKEALDLFEKANFSGTVIIPEFLVRNESNLEKDWIPIWEFTGLKTADVILFWIPRTRELIGLTTNYELGYWVAKEREKVIYGRPDDAYRISYPDIMWKEDANPGESTAIYNTLESTIKASMDLASRRYILRTLDY